MESNFYKLSETLNKCRKKRNIFIYEHRCSDEELEMFCQLLPFQNTYFICKNNKQLQHLVSKRGLTNQETCPFEINFNPSTDFCIFIKNSKEPDNVWRTYFRHLLMEKRVTIYTVDSILVARNQC